MTNLTFTARYVRYIASSLSAIAFGAIIHGSTYQN
jgi:hypothetical protein